MSKKKSKNASASELDSATRLFDVRKTLRSAATSIVDLVPPDSPVRGVAYRIAAAWMVVLAARMLAKRAHAIADDAIDAATALDQAKPEWRHAGGDSVDARFESFMKMLECHTARMRKVLGIATEARQLVLDAQATPSEIIKAMESECGRLRDEIAHQVQFPVDWQTRVFSALADIAKAARSEHDDVPDRVLTTVSDLIALSRARGEVVPGVAAASAVGAPPDASASSIATGNQSARERLQSGAQVEVRFGDDYSWVVGPRGRFEFTTPTQRAIIAVLAVPWRKGGDGCGMTTAAMHEAELADGTCPFSTERIRIRRTFRNSNALGHVLVSPSAGYWALYLRVAPDDQPSDIK